MSLQLHFTAPQTVLPEAVAWDRLERWLNDSGLWEAKFPHLIEFARAVSTKFARHLTPTADGNGILCPHSLEDCVHTHVLSLTLVGETEGLVEALVRLALRMSLTVLDPQTRTIHVPTTRTMYVVSAPTPKNCDMAWTLIRDWVNAPDRRAEPAPVLKDFVAEISGRYRMVNDPAEGTGILSDGPLLDQVGRCEVPVTMVCRPASDDLVPFTQAAIKRGLSVYYTHVRIPDRPLPGPPPADGNLPLCRLRMKDFTDHAQEWMVREFKPHGYSKRAREVYRKIPGGRQNFGFGTVNYLPINAVMGFFFGIRLDAVAKLAAELSEHEMNDKVTIQRCLSEFDPGLKEHEEHNQGAEVRRLDELDEYLRHTTPIVREKVIPLLDRVQSMESLLIEFPVTVATLTEMPCTTFEEQCALVYLTGGDWQSLLKEGRKVMETYTWWRDPNHGFRRHWEKVERNLRKLPPVS